MNKFTMMLAGVGIAVATVPAVASAAPWTPIAQRQANLNARIDQGIRSGSLTRPEAMRLRGQLRDVAIREDRYRRSGGLSAWERRDLNARFDRVSARVYNQKHDWQGR